MPEVKLQTPAQAAELPLPPTQQDAKTTESATAEKLCASLLETTLASAQLPPALETSLRERFSGVFTPAALDTAISEARQLVSDLTDRKVVQSAGRISDIVSREEQISAALHDLLGASRPDGLEKVHPARLSGIREFYTLMTGDQDFVGGYDQRAGTVCHHR